MKLLGARTCETATKADTGGNVGMMKNTKNRAGSALMILLEKQIGRGYTQEEGKLRKYYANTGDDGGATSDHRQVFDVTQESIRAAPVRCMQTWLDWQTNSCLFHCVVVQSPARCCRPSLFSCQISVVEAIQGKEGVTGSLTGLITHLGGRARCDGRVVDHQEI